MALVIDGYNLLHMTGILGSRVAPGGLERARRALLNFLAATLDAAERGQTTVVFDAREAPWGAAPQFEHHGIHVRFAQEYDDADSLIEELIHRYATPKLLTVVSSDRRLRRAAERRGAVAVPSEQWYREAVRRRTMGQVHERPEPRPQGPLSEAEVAFWLAEFAGVYESAELAAGENSAADFLESPAGDAAGPPADTATGAPAAPEADSATRKPGVTGTPRRSLPNRPAPDVDKPIKPSDRAANPFPPGYGEDLLE